MLEGTIVGRIAGVPITFLIDSGAEVNTVSGETFLLLRSNSKSRDNLFSITEGTDKVLKAYATPGEIVVEATFVAELFISPDRPLLMEKFYVIPEARALLSRGTAIRYSVLQLGLNVPIRKPSIEMIGSLSAGEICAVNQTSATEFPKFNIPPVSLSYDKSIPPSRRIYTNIPPAFKMETKKRINDLLESGIIERVTETMDKSFCSSLLVVPKGKDDIRLVVDLRGPNRSIIRTPFRMPTLESILANLDGATWFSTLDLTSAFFHIEIAEDSRHLTNFFAGDATYRFKRLPFGLTNSPDIFQEALQNEVLAGCRGTVNYLDDVLVFGKTREEHDDNLKVAFERFREHNVCLNSNKCVIGKQTVKFLGFSLSHDGLRVEDEKLQAVRNFRRPETQAEVKSFLGLINFSERFIWNRAEKTQRMRLLAHAESFYWNLEEEEEFNYLKNESLLSIK